jgi:glycosyltransferase involved in cell wall biosynthesis
MNIAVVSHDSFWPLKGGGGIRVFWVTKKLIERGHKITVIAPFLSTNGLENDFASIKIGNLGQITRFVKFKEVVYLFLMIKIFFKLLVTRFDLIYAHNVVAGFPSLLVAKLKRVPIVFDMDDILTGYSKIKFVHNFGPLIDYFTARHSDLTIVMSRYLEDKLKSKKINHVRKIPHGVDLSIFKPEKEKREFIIYTGGIEKNDGVLLVPEAAKKVLKIFPHERFLFIGDGKDLANLKRTVKEENLEDHFIFKGWIDHREIPRYLSRSKIGLVTSLKSIATEVSSTLRAYEYMSSGLPVVVPDLDGMVEQVGNGSRGLIFKCGDAEDLADKILMLLNGGGLWEKLRKRGREYIESNCDWDKNAGKIVELCENCGAN